jgi:hypothetical protein
MLVTATALALHACRRAPEAAPTANKALANTATHAQPSGPEADINASLAFNQYEAMDNRAISPVSAEPGALPPADADLRFVGRWAAERRMCPNAAWRFTAGRLTTPAGSACTFDHVKKVPGGYDIAAHCTAEGPERADTIRLRFAESARAMLFESESIADTGLIYCGE